MKMKQNYKKGDYVQGHVAKVKFVGCVEQQYGNFVDVSIILRDRKTHIAERIKDTFSIDQLIPLR